ncbi:MAG: DUF503 domain-containing protein [Ardenticatenia bacterium]|nr:DUF503 domain-containing protein [Ardenticatenia bacterium]
MIVSCWIELDLPSRTLKEKRRILKSALARMRQRFNVAVAEVDFQNVAGAAAICVVTVNSNGTYARGVLEQAIAWLERERPDVMIISCEFEVV